MIIFNLHKTGTKLNNQLPATGLHRDPNRHKSLRRIHDRGESALPFVAFVRETVSHMKQFSSQVGGGAASDPIPGSACAGQQGTNHHFTEWISSCPQITRLQRPILALLSLCPTHTQYITVTRSTNFQTWKRNRIRDPAPNIGPLRNGGSPCGAGVKRSQLGEAARAASAAGRRRLPLRVVLSEQ